MKQRPSPTLYTDFPRTLSFSSRLASSLSLAHASAVYMYVCVVLVVVSLSRRSPFSRFSSLSGGFSVSGPCSFQLCRPVTADLSLSLSCNSAPATVIRPFARVFVRYHSSSSSSSSELPSGNHALVLTPPTSSLSRRPLSFLHRTDRMASVCFVSPRAATAALTCLFKYR